MAQLDAHEAGDYGLPGPWGKMHPGHTRSWPYEDDDYDWSRMEVPPSRPSPRRRRWDEIHRPAYSAYAAPSSVATSRQRPAVTRCASVLLSSPSGMRHHHSATPLLGRHPAVPSISRAATASTGKLSSQQHYQRSPSGSRRAASQRDLSPQYRSTPVSRRSMRSSLGESDNETDLTRPSPEEDDEDDDEDDDDGVGPARSVFAERKSLRDRLGGTSKRPSLDFASASSSKQKPVARKQRQKQPKNKTKQKHARVDLDISDAADEAVLHNDLQLEREKDQESSILQQQEYPSPPQYNPFRQTSRGRSVLGTQGGQRRENPIREEGPRAERQADADAEMDKDDFDDDRRRPRPRRQLTPPRRTRRSLSRTTTDRRNVSRSKSRARPRDSDDFNIRASSRRPTNRYCETEVPDYAGSPATLRRAQTHGPASHANTPPSIDSPKRPASLFESPLDNTSYAFPSEKSRQRAKCLLCQDEFSSRLAKLECGHRMCPTCLKKKFKASLNDSRQMPPRCCSGEPIALRHVDKLLDASFKRSWNERYRDISLDTQMYCPKCGLLVTPDNRFRENGREVAQCARCRTRICGQCNSKAHASRECPPDDRTQLFLDKLRGEGRQHCHKCKAEVEYIEGRNHLTCGQCHAETCMICGRRWKQCGCPLFDCDVPEPARTEYGQHHYAPSVIRHDRLASAPPAPVPAPSPATPQRDVRNSDRSADRPYSAGRPMRSRAHSFDEKSRLRSRMDEHRPDDFGRRMNSYSGFQDGNINNNDEDDDARTEAYSRSVYKSRFDRDRSRQTSRTRAEDDFAIRPRRRRSFVVDDFEDRAATDILPSVPQPPPAPPTPPQQKAQAASVIVHRFQQHHQQHAPPQAPPSDMHAYQQEYMQHPEPRPRQPVAPSQHPGELYNTTPARPRTAVHVDSEVGRLAGRFSKDSRSSPMHRSTQAPPPPPPPPPPQGLPMAPMGGPMSAPMPMGMGMGVPTGPPMGTRAAVGPMAPHMPPMVGMGPQAMAPPPNGMHPSSIHPGGIHPMAMMPMAALPPVGHMPDIRMMRHHMIEDDAYAQSELAAMYPGSQVPFPDTSRHYEGPDAEVFASSSGINRRMRRRADDAALQAHQARSSEMAGLGGFGRGMDRVSEWRAYVGVEPPEEGSEIVSGVEM